MTAVKEQASPEQLAEVHEAQRAAVEASIKHVDLPRGNELPTVFQAWSSAMEDVIAVRKDSRNASQGFNFRGIDAVMNAAGPAFRKHGVFVVPDEVQVSYRDTQTTQGKATRETTAKVVYRVFGPRGDSFTFIGVGESLDQGDKGTAKAMSVAYRVGLLQALTIPTDEPDPDSSSYERAAAPAVSEDPSEKLRNEIVALAQEKRLTVAEVQEDFRSWCVASVGRAVEFDVAPATGLARYLADFKAGKTGNPSPEGTGASTAQ